MKQYKVTLKVDNHTHKPRRIYKYTTVGNLKEAWDFAHKVCSDYNKSHKTKAAIVGVSIH